MKVDHEGNDRLARLAPNSSNTECSSFLCAVVVGQVQSRRVPGAASPMELDVHLRTIILASMKTISVTSLKTHLSREIRKVQMGESIVVTDRQVPVAELIPFRSTGISVIAAKEPLKRLKIEHSIRINIDPHDLLMEDRQRR